MARDRAVPSGAEPVENTRIIRAHSASRTLPAAARNMVIAARNPGRRVAGGRWRNSSNEDDPRHSGNPVHVMGGGRGEGGRFSLRTFGFILRVDVSDESVGFDQVFERGEGKELFIIRRLI